MVGRFVVYQKRYTDTTWHAAGYFESEQEALAEYEELRQTYRRERVWVVDQDTDQIIADSRRK